MVRPAVFFIRQTELFDRAQNTHLLNTLHYTARVAYRFICVSRRLVKIKHTAGARKVAESNRLRRNRITFDAQTHRGHNSLAQPECKEEKRSRETKIAHESIEVDVYRTSLGALRRITLRNMEKDTFFVDFETTFKYFISCSCLFDGVCGAFFFIRGRRTFCRTRQIHCFRTMRIRVATATLAVAAT